MSQGLDVKVWRDYEQFLQELSNRFPKERKGIRKFYDECWRVFNSLNSLELKSLEEPRYLLGREVSDSLSTGCITKPFQSIGASVSAFKMACGSCCMEYA